jgi:hypothetical protein
MKAKPVLKQFSELTPADFSKHPVWVSVHGLDQDEPWYDETDEETFRPWPGSLPVGPEEGMLLVRAKLTLADGRAFQGFITPQYEGEPLSLGRIQPQMFLPSGKRCDFWDGMFKRPDNDRQIIYVELGDDPKKIFPIEFSAEEGLATGQVSGSIPGFCWCPEGQVKIYQ